MSVSLLSTQTSSPLCPHCHSDFLEHLDSPLITPNPNSILDQIPTQFQFPSAAADDNFLLDSPYLHRLIQHLANSESDGSSPSNTTSRYHSPASKSAVEAIPDVTISKELLESDPDPDPVILCAVCKDQFVVDVTVKRLPCNHMYHPDCILPWLSQHNSCPVCRFQLPTDSDDSKTKRRSRFNTMRLGELMDDEELLASTLRHIARRHSLVYPNGRNYGGEATESLFSPTQIAEAEVSSVERSNSVETVSSWPNWPLDGVPGEIGGGASVNDEADIAIS